MSDNKRENIGFEVIFLGVMLAIGGVIYADTSRMRIWQQKFTVEILFYVAVALACLRLIYIVVQHFRDKESFSFVKFDQIDGRTLVFTGALVGLALLIPIAGLFVSLFVFIVPMMVFLGVRPWYVALIISLVTIAIFWSVLVPTLGVRLPRGLFF